MGCVHALHSICHVTPLSITNIGCEGWKCYHGYQMSGSQKCEDKTMNRGNGREATLSETCLTIIYRDTRGVLKTLRELL